MPRVSAIQGTDKEQLQAKLKSLANEISIHLSALEAAQIDFILIARNQVKYKFPAPRPGSPAGYRETVRQPSAGKWMLRHDGKFPQTKSFF